MSSIRIRSARRMRRRARPVVSSARWRGTTHDLAELFEAEPQDVGAGVDGGVAKRFEEVGLPSARRPADDEVLVVADPLQGPQRGLGGGGDRAGRLVPGVEGLPSREPGCLAASADARGSAAGDLLGEEGPDSFGRVQPLRLCGGQQVGAA